jgi:DNA primase large subunit
MAPSSSEWTLNTLGEHFLALREADSRFDAERDRRYTSEAALRAEALRIKEEGDRRALELAREIQAYRDEQANNLREQISAERGHYVSHNELGSAIEKIEETLKPIASYVAGQIGRSGGLQSGWGWLVALIGILIGVAGLASKFFGH